MPLHEASIHRQVAALHAANIDQGFLATLGVPFLALMYRAIDEAADSVLLVEERDGRVIDLSADAAKAGCALPGVDAFRRAPRAHQTHPEHPSLWSSGVLRAIASGGVVEHRGRYRGEGNRNGRSTVFAACDTFPAVGRRRVQDHGRRRLGFCPCLLHQNGGVAGCAGGSSSGTWLDCVCPHPCEPGERRGRYPRVINCPSSSGPVAARPSSGRFGLFIGQGCSRGQGGNGNGCSPPG